MIANRSKQFYSFSQSNGSGAEAYPKIGHVTLHPCLHHLVVDGQLQAGTLLSSIEFASGDSLNIEAEGKGGIAGAIVPDGLGKFAFPAWNRSVATALRVAS